MSDYDNTFRGKGNWNYKKNFSDIRSIIPWDTVWNGGVTTGTANKWGQIWATGGTCESGIRVKNSGGGAVAHVTYVKDAAAGTLNGRHGDQGTMGLTAARTMAVPSTNAGIGGHVAGYELKQGEEIFIEGRQLGYVWASSPVAGTTLHYWAT
jgi:hypothetical protein